MAKEATNPKPSISQIYLQTHL